MPNKNPAVCHNGSNYDYGFKVECLVEKTEKYKAFSVPIEKEFTKINKEIKML